jgi:hypothetical protein
MFHDKKKLIARTCEFPVPMYRAMRRESCRRGISIMQLIVQSVEQAMRFSVGPTPDAELPSDLSQECEPRKKGRRRDRSKVSA